MKISVFIATSLDGFIARPDGGLDWLPASPEPHGYDEFMATVDALLVGRKTYETVLGFGGWVYGTKPVFVLSMSPLAPAPKEAVVAHLSGEPETIVAQLISRGLAHIYLDGGVTIQRFLRAGLVDRMIITRIPVLLGNGIPLFGTTAGDIHFTHVSTRSYPSGLVQSEYQRAQS